MTAPRAQSPRCLDCGTPAEIRAGSEVWPTRRDLWSKFFWLCPTPGCGARCGCHGQTKIPLGRPAGHALREARIKLHARLDPIWREAPDGAAYAPESPRARNMIQNRARTRVYAWLADRMGLTADECHVGLFTIEQCRVAWRHIVSTNYDAIRDWAKAREGSKAA